MILKDKNSHIDWLTMQQTIHTLLQAAEHLDAEKIQMLLRQISPTYRPRTFATSSNRTSISSI